MLMVQGQMGLIRTNSLWLLVVLLFASFAVSLDYTKEEEEEAFLNQLVDPSTGEIDDDLVNLFAPLVCSSLHSIILP